jgi:phospholipid-binding lipoprotein MlaA
MTNTKFLSLAIAAALFVPLAACSTTGKPSEAVYVGNEQIQDPIEGVNRTTFAINEAVDKAILEPVARGYRNYTPSVLRVTMRNFLRNLRQPLVMGNELLQGDLKGFGNATARLFINTTAGFGGLFDVAEMGGIAHQPEDFGQTLAVWGVGNGPYVVLPIFGPSTARDATGLLVDSFADPIRIYMFNHDLEWLHYTRMAVSGIDQREELLDVIDDLRRNSFDYYAAIRSAYYQRRQALVNDMNADNASSVEIPDYGN